MFSQFMAHFVVFLVVLIFVLMMGGLIFIALWGTKQAVKNAERDKTLKTKYDASLVGVLKHKSGLPLPPNVIVEIAYGKDNIYFKNEGNEIRLSKDKVVYIDTQVGGDFVGGAIAGKAITGDSGAALASAALSSVEYLIITYNANNKVNRIVLENYGRLGFPRKIAKDFKEIYKNKPGIKAEL